MTATATPARHGYSSLQIALHWIIFALFWVNWFLGESMEHAYDALMEGEGGGEAATSLGGAYSHVIIGLAVLLLMVARLAARLRRPVVTNPEGRHAILDTLGTISHWAFYGLLIAIPLLGALAWFGGVDAAGGLHKLLVTATVVLIGIHVLAALFHQFVLKDHLIRRMMRPTGGT